MQKSSGRYYLLAGTTFVERQFNKLMLFNLHWIVLRKEYSNLKKTRQLKHRSLACKIETLDKLVMILNQKLKNLI